VKKKSPRTRRLKDLRTLEAAFEEARQSKREVVVPKAIKSLAAANDEVVLNASGEEIKEIIVQLVGAFVGVVQLQVSNDDTNTNFIAIQVNNLNTGGAAATDMTAPGVYKAVVSSVRQAKAKMTTFTSGGPTVATVSIGKV